MTTYEQGRAPEGAPVTWLLLPHSTAMACIALPDGSSIDAHRLQADAICRAFRVAKLAEDYAKAKAALDAAATAAEMESVRAAYYDASRALCEAVRL